MNIWSSCDRPTAPRPKWGVYLTTSRGGDVVDGSYNVTNLLEGIVGVVVEQTSLFGFFADLIKQLPALIRLGARLAPAGRFSLRGGQRGGRVYSEEPIGAGRTPVKVRSG